MANVLLIEPDRILAQNCKAALRRSGHIVVWRSGGQAAIGATEKAKPDIILLELQLPRHNGLEFLYELRSYPEWQGIPVILLTLVPDVALQAEQSALERLGIAGYLYKPQTKLAHVVRAINRLSDEQSSCRQEYSSSAN